MSKTRVIGAVALGVFGLACLVATAYAYSELSVVSQMSRLPGNYQRKMVAMQLAPLAGGVAFGAVVSNLTRYRRAWIYGFFAMLPLALFMMASCLQFIMIHEPW